MQVGVARIGASTTRFLRFARLAHGSRLDGGAHERYGARVFVSYLVMLRRPSSAGLAVSALPILIAFGCSAARYSTEPGAPTLVVPARFAEGGTGKAEASALAPSAAAVPRGSASAPTGSASAATAAAPVFTPSTAPDPTALQMAEQVEYELELSDGKPHVISVKAVKLPAPVVTPRRLGRYAIELSIGQELIERVRFDFPGTAADEPQVGAKQPLFAPLTLSARAIARVKVMLPQSPRVRRALLVDRALNTATELEWPLPSVPPAASSASSASAAKAPPAAPSAKAPPVSSPAALPSAPSAQP